MDYYLPLLVAFLMWACFHFLFISGKARRSSGKCLSLPPGPRPLPLLGNLLQLGHQPHRSITSLSKTHGPVMSLQLGAVTSVILSSSRAAKQALHLHDKALSSRAITDSVRALRHHEASLVFLPATAQWRMLRRACSLHVFSPPRLDAGQTLRRKKVDALLAHVRESATAGLAVDVGRAAFATTLNLLSNTVFSVDLAGLDSGSSESTQEFKDLVWGVMERAGVLNISDYFPALRRMDLQGARRRTAVYFRRLLEIFDGLIERRLDRRSQQQPGSSSAEGGDVLDALLNSMKNNEQDHLSCYQIKHLLLDLFIAGTDTTSNTLEWAMAELLHNPETMIKAQKELAQVLGKDTPLQESDIPRLPFLQAIVKETFRLHPVAPFLVPHKAEMSVEICGFTIPKDAQVLVNIWAIGRDPSLWTNPNSFEPERFLGSEIDVKGRDFELIPFGAGRRICPGLSLAHRMLHLMLGSLLQFVEWKLEDGKKVEALDISEKYGITLKKAEPLRVIPIMV